MVKLQKRHAEHWVPLPERFHVPERLHLQERRRAHLARAGAWMPLVAGVGLAGVGIGQAYHRIKERRWLQEEVALLPFPVRRDE